MGQYKQWQHYREIDQQLLSQLKQLSGDLASLQTQAQQLEQDLSLADNAIIRSLFAQLLPPPAPIIQETQAEPASTIPFSVDGTTRTVSGETELTIKEPALPEEVTPVTQKAFELSAEDMEILSDEQGQTAPLRAIPWWFRNTPIHPSNQDGPFSDQQSSRTNQRVERWLERWGRGEDASPTQEEQR